MLTYRLLGMDGSLFVMRECLTDDQYIPVPIRAQHQVGCNRHPNERAMQFDFQMLSHLGGDLQPCINCGIEGNVLAILTQLYGVPAIRGFKAGKPNVYTEIFQLKVPIVCLTESIGKRLHGRSGHVLTTTSLEACRQVIRGRKRAIRVELRFQHFQHLVVDDP